MARQRTAIDSLPFRHNVNPQLGLEIFRLSELYDRAERNVFDHALETPRRHDFHTIHVGLRGSGTVVIDFAPVPLGAGYLTFLARGRVRQFIVDRSVDAWLLLFMPELLGTDRDDPLRAPAILSPVCPDPALALSARDQRDVLALVEQLRIEHDRAADSFQPAILAALLRALLLRAERLHTAGGRTLAAPVERFFTILERDHAKTRAVAHYAKQTGISARRLGELLVEYTGKSTKQVIDERVVLEHKRLLAHTDASIKELAAATGFDEPTNLVKFFRHHTGQTPLAFRTSQRTFLPAGRRF